MSLELACRFTVAMTLSPECGHRETMARLAGHLLDVPWARRWHVPTAKVFTSWRRLGWQVMEEVFWQAAGSIAGPGTPPGQAALWCGRELCAIDGFQIDLPGHRRQPGRVRVLGHQRRYRPVPAGAGGAGDRAGRPGDAGRGDGRLRRR